VLLFNAVGIPVLTALARQPKAEGGEDVNCTCQIASAMESYPHRPHRVSAMHLNACFRAVSFALVICFWPVSIDLSTPTGLPFGYPGRQGHATIPL